MNPRRRRHQRQRRRGRNLDVLFTVGNTYVNYIETGARPITWERLYAGKVATENVCAAFDEAQRKAWAEIAAQLLGTAVTLGASSMAAARTLDAVRRELASADCERSMREIVWGRRA